jgi:hypothetical protein
MSAGQRFARAVKTSTFKERARVAPEGPNEPASRVTPNHGQGLRPLARASRHSHTSTAAERDHLIGQHLACAEALEERRQDAPVAVLPDGHGTEGGEGGEGKQGQDRQAAWPGGGNRGGTGPQWLRRCAAWR